MILKKPYALLIKYFRLIHFFLSIFIVYMIYKVNILLKFFNTYMDNQISVVGQNLKENLFTNLMYIMPLIILIVSIPLLWLMVRKKKPYRFYLINTIIYIVIFIMILYISSFLERMETSVVDIVNVRVVRDLLTIAIMLQSVSLIVSFIRTIGFDIKSFEFLSDLQQLEISEEDKEEYELDFSIDSNERKRKRKRKIRYLKYTYRENKILINLIILILISIVCFIVYRQMSIYVKLNNEGTVFSTSYYNLGVDESYLINTNYKGNIITDNYLVVVNLKIKKKNRENKLLTGNLKLQVGEQYYAVTNKYDKYLLDIGTVYDNQSLSNEYNNYLLVFEIPKEDINQKIKLIYLENKKDIKIKLNPIKFDENCNEMYDIGEEMKVGDNTVNISNYELSESYTIDYDYCIKDECYKSIQYLYPTLNTNYDKVILKIIGSADIKENNVYTNFNQLLSNLATINYTLNGDNKTSSFTRITNLKTQEYNTFYYEVNKELMSADNISLVFNTRKCKYFYNFK